MDTKRPHGTQLRVRACVCARACVCVRARMCVCADRCVCAPVRVLCVSATKGEL